MEDFGGFVQGGSFADEESGEPIPVLHHLLFTENNFTSVYIFLSLYIVTFMYQWYGLTVNDLGRRYNV